MTVIWLIWIGCFVVSLGALEAVSYYRNGTAGTLSDHVRKWTRQWPIIPFWFGVLVGVLSMHFWAHA